VILGLLLCLLLHLLLLSSFVLHLVLLQHLFLIFREGVVLLHLRYGGMERLIEHNITTHMQLASRGIKQPVPLSIICISKEDAFQCLSIELAAILTRDMHECLTPKYAEVLHTRLLSAPHLHGCGAQHL